MSQIFSSRSHLFLFLSYFPTWSYEEIKKLQTQHPTATDEHVLRMFAVFGGVPRYIFYYTSEHAFSRLRGALLGSNPEEVFFCHPF